MNVDARAIQYTIEETIIRELPGLGQARTREVTRAIESLLAGIRPERIYAFGSFARGDADADSDLDLLLVVDDSHEPGYRRDQAALRAIGLRRYPLDLIVLTRAEFDGRRTVPSSLPATVLREGKLLYER